MNRLQFELHRLYLTAPAGPAGEAIASGLLGAHGMVRAMVLELCGPADWESLSRVWRGVQADLGWPAPAIAVSGTDGLQLWFSLVAPVPMRQAAACLDALRARYLPEVASRRVRMLPAVDADNPAHGIHARLVPAEQAEAGHWSAFVAPDLAAVFADAPWLDIPPGEEGQASLLRGLDSIAGTAFEAASAVLAPSIPAPGAAPEPVRDGDGPSQVRPAAPPAGRDPRTFLLQVMNDESVALSLRIEAAKALLPFGDAALRAAHDD